MGSVRVVRVDWGEVSASGYPVPDDVPLTDLTAELAEMLGAEDPAVRERVAVATLTAWLRRGVYDDLLPGLGDGMAAALVGRHSADRRGCSASVLAACIARDRQRRRVPDETVLVWGDRLVTWLLAESEPGVIGRGADALSALAAHPAFGGAELAVLLDVVGERAAGVTDNATGDRLAVATLAVLRRDLVPVDVVEAWLEHIGTDAATYLRSLYVLLSLVREPPPHRADLALLVVDRLRAVHPELRSGS